MVGDTEIRAIPTVIQIRPGEDSRSAKRRRDRKRQRSISKQHHNTSNDGKVILPHEQYRNELEKVIQRDFFPELEEQDGVSSTALTHKTTGAATANDSLSSFHTTTTSDRHVRLQNRCEDRSSTLRIEAEKKYSKKTKTETNHKSSTVVLNPLFFGPPQTVQQQPNRKPATLLLKNSEPSNECSKNVCSNSTRFPRLRRLPPVPNHWEPNDRGGDDDASDAMTDLDSTVVASIRSEIRQGRIRGTQGVALQPTAQQQQQQQQPSSHQFSYQLPQPSFREACAAELLETKRSRPLQKKKRTKERQQSTTLRSALKSAYTKKSKTKRKKRDP